MPTDLPGSRRKRRYPAKAVVAPKPSAFSRLLNTFMIGTVLALFALVLLQEKRYADGLPGSVADGLMQKAQAAIIGDADAGDASAN